MRLVAIETEMKDTVLLDIYQPAKQAQRSHCCPDFPGETSLSELLYDFFSEKIV